MKIALVGHTISPFRGSEPGNTWNWAWHLSQHVEIEVFAHPHYRKEVEAFLAENPNPRLRVTWVELQGKDPWDQTNERGLRLHYWLWLSEVRGRLRHALEGKKGTLIHHVSWSTVSAPPPFTGLDVPVVWGPVGGGQTSPLSFLWFYGREAPGELLRSLRVKALPLLPSWRARVRGYARVFATNRETARLLELVRSDVQLWLDTGIPLGFGSEPTARRPGEEGEFTLLWAGRLEPIKGFPLALEALRLTSFPVRLVVAGQGSMLSRYRKMVAKLGLAERVQFLGRVPYDKDGGPVPPGGCVFVHESPRFLRIGGTRGHGLRRTCGGAGPSRRGDIRARERWNQGACNHLPPDGARVCPGHRPPGAKPRVAVAPGPRGLALCAAGALGQAG